MSYTSQNLSVTNKINEKMVMSQNIISLHIEIYGIPTIMEVL